ncbi:hypothetical protein DOY81_007193 [Sarcophaga bullata]|nr:hypothetical protein DOY81_007193 [Sarcophaga bullata]
MGIKDLWSILAPYAERKPICELRGKTVAIDLAGWVCESLNVVDYFVHPRHHLKNLFFRTCYLIWEDITPVFVLEGAAPKLKSQVIEKRNEIQFRGVKPKEKPTTQNTKETQNSKGDKGRTRFNHVLKQCENLLHAMGIQCVQGPGEAEAYCAFLNVKGLVDGVISQDSDCFAYGALRVYRNFSISTQGALAAQGGAVDIYDMRNICSKIDFGQHKVIVMGLLCGCDYCPEGIGGIGRDSVMKLFNKYKNDEILKRIRSWRKEDDKFTALEMRVDDKTICSYCGHYGRTQSHTKNGCGICRTNQGCDESLWKEERISIKAELTLRKKALADANFPSKEIIEEFLEQPKEIPRLKLDWGQPNMIKFVRQIGHLLQWPELYCFQKFFPILTRWQIINFPRLKELPSAINYIEPKQVLKKRVLKGVPSLEILWHDERGVFKGLIPDDQMDDFLSNNPKGLQDLWSTVEPLDKVERAYPTMVVDFLKSKEKPKKLSRKAAKNKIKSNDDKPLGSLENLNDIIDATKDIAKTIKNKQTTKINKASRQGLQMIDHFFKQKEENKSGKILKYTPTKWVNMSSKVPQCSTPLTKNIPSDLESDIDENDFDMSGIVNGIIRKSHKHNLSSHKGQKLCYDEMPKDTSYLINDQIFMDDLDIMCEKRSLSNSFRKATYNEAKRMSSMDDSFDILVKKGGYRNEILCKSIRETDCVFNKFGKPNNFVDRFKDKQCISSNVKSFDVKEINCESDNNISYFFDSSFQGKPEDEFEKFVETSFTKYFTENETRSNVFLLSD